MATKSEIIQILYSLDRDALKQLIIQNKKGDCEIFVDVLHHNFGEKEQSFYDSVIQELEDKSNAS